MSELGSAHAASNGSAPIDDNYDELERFVRPLLIDDDTIYHLAYEFSQVYRHLALHSSEQFLPTPVTHLPSGNETGQFLAIDVGSTNLRVAFIELLGDLDDQTQTKIGLDRTRETIRNAQRPRVRRTLEKAWPIGEHLKKDKTEDLFAWIGDCIAEVVGDRLSSDSGRVEAPDVINMGITFSFPMMQDELTSATLMPMGKGFTITSDLDLGSTLLKGYARHTRRQSPDLAASRSKRRRLGPLPRLRIAAITNDTIATFASLAYRVKSLPNSRVAAGIIVGTGCNATIPMKFSDLGEAKTVRIRRANPDATATVVNTEITIAGACGPLEAVTTRWDRELDEHCARPGFQPLEYMTGGRYIGELVRIIFYDYMTRSHRPPIPPASLPSTVVHSYSFTTTFVSAVVARSWSDAELAVELKRRIPPPESSGWAWSSHSAGALRKIAHLVQVRSAGLIAASTVGLLHTVGEITLQEPSLDARVDVLMEGDTPNAALATPRLLSYRGSREVLSPAPGAGAWKAGPEELVIAYTGGIIQHYPNFKDQCQRFIDRLVMRAGPQDGGKSVFLREARDGGIIGAGVLASLNTKP
ncbi:hypothetical protein DV735_g2431, partial [Chaetothyriales sp. CBS 134920]